MFPSVVMLVMMCWVLYTLVPMPNSMNDGVSMFYWTLMMVIVVMMFVILLALVLELLHGCLRVELVYCNADFILSACSI